MPLSTQILDTAKIIILAALLVVGVNYAFAVWTGAPASGPPNDNVPPPVNVGNNPQGKNAGFSASTLGATVLNVDATDNGVGVYDISIVGGSSGGITVGNGNIIASNGAVKGESIENLGGTARIDSTGAVTAGHGTFTGGVVVGESDGTVEYLQMDNKSGLENPNDADCNALADGGKMFFDSSIGVLYLCMKGRSELNEDGWKPVFIDYASTQQ